MSNVLILGASSGMAQSIAKKYASEGWSLTLASRSQESIVDLRKDLEVRYESEVEVVTFDAQDFSGHRSFYRSLKDKPDLVVAAFGYMGDQALARNDWGEIAQTIDVNFSGMASILSIVAEDFEARKRGTIVAISSVAGDRGRQSNYVYGAAKAGLTAFLSGLRNRLAPVGVHVMTVKPGFAYTKMTEHLELPKLLSAQPDQIANAVFRGVERRKNVIYTLWMWRHIMLVIRHIPEFIFKKLGL